MAVPENSTTQQAPIDYDKLFAAIQAMDSSAQAKLAEQIALMNVPKPEVVVQATIDNLQAASPAPVSPAGERLAELLKQPEPEKALPDQIVDAQDKARRLAAGGKDAAQITAELGATVDVPVAQAVAPVAVREVDESKQLAKLSKADDEHRKNTGTHTPVAEHANPFAAALAAAGVTAREVIAPSMLQHHDPPVTRIADAAKQREAEPVRGA